MYGGGGNPASNANTGDAIMGGGMANDPNMDDLNVRKADSIKFESLLGGPELPRPGGVRRRH